PSTHFSSTLTSSLLFSCFFFNDPSPTDIYTLSLHDALPIWSRTSGVFVPSLWESRWKIASWRRRHEDCLRLRRSRHLGPGRQGSVRSPALGRRGPGAARPRRDIAQHAVGRRESAAARCDSYPAY